MRVISEKEKPKANLASTISIMRSYQRKLAFIMASSRHPNFMAKENSSTGEFSLMESGFVGNLKEKVKNFVRRKDTTLKVTFM